MLKEKHNIKSNPDHKKDPKQQRLPFKRFNASKNKPQEVATFLPSTPIMSKEQVWLEYEITSQKDLKKEDRLKRNQLFEFLFLEIGPTFYLISRTLQHTIKLLDIYYGKCALKKGNTKGHIYPDKEELLIDFVTSIFMCAKYNEVYPPMLMDLIDFCQGEEIMIDRKKVLNNQFTIFETLDISMNVALVSDWWKIKHQQLMPLWVHFCYLDFDLKDRSREIFDEVMRFIEAVMKSAMKEEYEAFVKESDSWWNVKEGCKNRRKTFHRGCVSVYKAFVDFRQKAELPAKLIPTQNNLL